MMTISATDDIVGKPMFCSWSGGKDSCLALYHAIQHGGSPKVLFTMLDEEAKRSRSHGLPVGFLRRQAEQLGLPVIFNSAAWSDYEARYQETLKGFRAQGLVTGVFGDIDGEENRDWCVRMCATAGMGTYHPLWKRQRKDILKEFIGLGFKSTIVVTQADKLGSEWLGRQIDAQTIEDLEKTGIDVCGELGEYHTAVTGGPIFNSELVLETEEAILHDGHWFLRIAQ